MVDPIWYVKVPMWVPIAIMVGVLVVFRLIYVYRSK
jgi:hypothetical protein